MNEDLTGDPGTGEGRPTRPAYRMIGADGKEYGPITAEQLRLWIAEGRANAQTRVRAEEALEWKNLADLPEFASALGPTAPPGGGSLPPPFEAARAPTAFPLNPPAPDAASQVSGPAIGLIIVAVLNILSSGASVLMQLAGVNFIQMPMDQPGAAWMPMFHGSIAIISGVLTAALSVLILLGGLKMQKLESHGLAVTASVLALLPCTSPCCILGLPIGIWALVVLLRPEVKNAFR
jgi:hypothetical protein